MKKSMAIFKIHKSTGTLMEDVSSYFASWQHQAMPPPAPWQASPWATARSNAACAVVSRSGGACSWCCGKPVQVMEAVLGSDGVVQQ
eukprot:CAMPEP_0206382112 /NCGR_PEP_ID=MMETSP0294-20121207/13066_1 /ASSEMBLY_ACC=CAM_ASM_000327 /TAXON_ID=39354 /ORGANISM="Heterosigma akashiwo, Strain CCMP2393" /LENGTH=86 /DNA_ID=CAMNT_0053831731 /DNA_START=547 /DNA_END=807 /DNA_ORIENTATION=-